MIFVYRAAAILLRGAMKAGLLPTVYILRSVNVISIAQDWAELRRVNMLQSTNKLNVALA